MLHCFESMLASQIGARVSQFQRINQYYYRRAQPFNLPAHPFNLSISDKLWTLEKNKGHFIILELNSGIIKWPLFFSKVHSLSDIDRLKGCAGRLKECALRY